MRKRLLYKLAGTLSSEDLSKVYNSFDIIGDIAIIKHSNIQEAQTIAKQIITVHKNIKTIFTATSPFTGAFRVRALKLLVGENRIVTKHKEAGCTFKVDLEKCYFSPRLSHERLRIANLVKPFENVVNMFAGVGCFSILIAKIACQPKVYSIDINPVAFLYMEENVRINKVYDRVYPILGDAKEIIQTQLQAVADRVLMPLPEKALDYLPYALKALRKTGGWIHFYDFQHSVKKENPIEKTKLKVEKKLDSLSISYVFVDSRIVRSIGPNWYQTVIDVKVFPLPNKF